MSCTRSPPSSPRAPKIQHQSWNEPSIGLYNPNENIPPRSPSRYEPPKSPKSPRKFDKKINIYFEPKSPKSPRKFDFAIDQRSPKFDYGDNCDVYPPKSPKLQRTKGTLSNGQYYSTSQRSQSSSNNTPTTATTTSSSPSSSSYYDSQSIAKSPKSPRKFNYDAISPKYDQNAINFEYFDTTTPNDERKAFIETPQKSPKQFKKKQQQQQQQHQQHQQQQHQQQQQQQQQQHSKREQSPDSFNYDKRNSVVTESTISGDSEATTAVCSSGNGVSSNCCEPINNKERDCDGRWDNRRRRHAINITSNPGYQVLHGSHSTLDRTCSDSVMSIRKCRKSTSDLTEASELNAPANIPTATPKRRGSSKGGLAYLASRRGSRDSIKSAVSNASIFSNEEDIGPLAFQSSTRGRQRRTSNFLELPVPDHIRPRVCSLPERPYNPRQSDDLYRLRTFSISKGTVVNCGDSIISRRSRSNTSVNSTNSRASERSPFDGSCCHFRFNATVDSLPPSPTDSEIPLPRYRVVLLGDSGVGKTALVSQFMTSEYMHTYDASLDDEFGEKTVSILLDGEESDMIFIDHPSHEMSVENSLSTYEPHGCIIIYSVVARSSFRIAEEIINYLWTENVTKDKSVILVGNKADLARSRVITTAEGKSLATSRDAKFIETSSGIQHNVDELLVGILKQIRLKETRDKKAAVSATKMRNSKTHMSLHLAKEILQKIGISDISKSKSCENLHVL